MPIQSGDVKLLKSANMDDVPEGGGPPSSGVIADGVSNAIFPDISELDRAGGRASLKKTFVSIQTDDRDNYFGANVIVADPPDDPRVSVTLFSTKNVFDKRAQAASRVESYLNKGPEWPGYLFENHIAGQRVIQLFQRPNDVVPNVGQTLCLVQNEGQGTQIEQYIRVTVVSSVMRTFTYDGDKDFQANVVTVTISDALRTDFIGSPASRQFARLPNAAKTRDTVVADAGTYVGVSPLTATAALGDFTVRAQTMFTQLVPSAQTETPIVAAAPYAQAALPARTKHPVTYTSNQNWSATTNLSLPGGCTPASLTIVSAGTTIVDKAGLLMVGVQQVGIIDYANGTLSLLTGTYNGAKQITYEPAAYIPRMPQSEARPITAESRAQNYVGFVSPGAMPGSLSISYQAQGRWYVLSDTGDGTLRGYDASFGAGTYNPNSGDYVVSLGALPDVGSALVLQWGVPTQEYAHPTASLNMAQTVALSTDATDMLDPTFLELTWTVSGVPKTASAQTNGSITGDATGVIDTVNSEITFTPNSMPLFGTEVAVAYDTGPQNETALSHPSRNGLGRLAVDAGGVNLVPGSVAVEWNTFTDLTSQNTYTRAQVIMMGIAVESVDPIQVARDDGAGNLLWNGSQVGTVNYTTGAIDFQPDVVIRIPSIQYSSQQVIPGMMGDGAPMRLNYSGITYVQAASTYPNDESGWVKIRFYSATSSTRKNQTFVYQPSFRLVPGLSAPATPGSVVLKPNTGAPWGDNGVGVLREFTDTGWVQRGTIDYATARVTLTAWPVGISGQVTRATTLTSLGENISSAYVFRTATAPLRPGSLAIQYAAAGGGVQVVTAGVDGTISAAGVVGVVDHETGLVRVGFGAYVTAAGNEAEPWYDSSRVLTNGTIFKPAPVQSSTMKYTAGAYSYLPLDAALLGIDPVRLPSDGRVPIFRPGGFAVVGHTASVTATVSNAQVIDCARTRLSRVRIIGADGAVIHSGYTADLEAGLVTFTDVTGYSQPVTIQHRIEDMAVVREASISGEVTFTRPVTHNYPLGSYVSSALVAGDLFSRVQTVFDQATWNGTWSDSVVGAEATGTFNTTQYPIVVTNRGALTERYVVRFTGATTFEVIGEHIGVIATGNTGVDCTPNNPATGVPYFTIPAGGWGSGWAAGNILRINTIGAEFPVWVVRTVQQGPESVPDDSFTLLIRGDVDTP